MAAGTVNDFSASLTQAQTDLAQIEGRLPAEVEPYYDELTRNVDLATTQLPEDMAAVDQAEAYSTFERTAQFFNFDEFPSMDAFTELALADPESCPVPNGP